MTANGISMFPCLSKCGTMNRSAYQCRLCLSTHDAESNHKKSKRRWRLYHSQWLDQWLNEACLQTKKTIKSCFRQCLETLARYHQSMPKLTKEVSLGMGPHHLVSSRTHSIRRITFPSRLSLPCNLLSRHDTYKLSLKQKRKQMQSATLSPIYQ